MAARIVGDQRMRHAVRAKLEGRERGALIARPRLIHPHMHANALVMGAIDRRERRAPIDASEPPGIAMGEDIDGGPALLLGVRTDDSNSVLPDFSVRLDIFVANLSGAGERRRHALVARLVAHGLLHLIERPAEVDGGWTGGGERLASAIEPLIEIGRAHL